MDLIFSDALLIDGTGNSMFKRRVRLLKMIIIPLNKKLNLKFIDTDYVTFRVEEIEYNGYVLVKLYPEIPVVVTKNVDIEIFVNEILEKVNSI